MTERNWRGVVGRITTGRPVDLDSGAAPTQEHGAVKSNSWPQYPVRIAPPPSQGLLTDPEHLTAAIGVRITAPVVDVTDLAIRLASVAIEREIEPVILTSLADCGLEQFGFRVERLCAPTPDGIARQELELTQLWGLAVVLDANDLAGS